MTTKRKIQILKRAINYFEDNPKAGHGMCYAISQELKPEESKYDPSLGNYGLGFYGIRKPKDADFPFWFPRRDIPSNKRRIKLLQNAIKRLTKRISK